MKDIAEGAFGNGIMIGDSYFMGTGWCILFQPDMASPLAHNLISQSFHQ